MLKSQLIGERQSAFELDKDEGAGYPINDAALMAAMAPSDTAVTT